VAGANAAIAIAAMQTLVAILIAPSPPSDLDAPILELSYAWVGGGFPNRG
jgi:hypothetical protein